MNLPAKSDVEASESAPRVFEHARYATEPLPHCPDAPAVAGRDAISARSPAGWICLGDFNLTPVLDDVSRHLYLANNALEDKDEKTAACELGAVASALRRGAVKAGRRDGAAACVDADLAQFASWRLASSAVKVRVVAQTIEGGGFHRKIALAGLIDTATCTDIERRWLVTDEDIWYPVCGEPQRHFTDAIGAFEKQDRRAAVTEIRKASSYLRLEAGRTTGYAKRALDGAVGGLGRLAMSIAVGMLSTRKSIDDQFAIADLSLALAHRVKSSEWWVQGDHRISGYALKAAARCLDAAAAWVGSALGTGACRVARDAEALGERLVCGDRPPHDEISRGFVAFGNAVEALGLKIAARRDPGSKGI